MKIYSHIVAGKTQADGAVAVGMSTVNFDAASNHSVVIIRRTATSGTISVRVKPALSDKWMTLEIGGNSTIFDLSVTDEPQEYAIEWTIDAVEVTPTNVNGTYDVIFSGWN